MNSEPLKNQPHPQNGLGGPFMVPFAVVCMISIVVAIVWHIFTNGG